VLAAPLAAQRSPDALPYQHIIVLRDNTQRAAPVANELASRHGLGVLYVYEHALKGFAATVPDAALNALRGDARVKFISEDRVVRAFAQTLPTGVNRINAENRANKGNGVNVAVIDTGIDLDHPDLQANIKGGVNCSTGSTYDDGNGHGSHVAGTIAAVTNDIGTTPDSEAGPV
jgi:subtilisin family serine protease